MASIFTQIINNEIPCFKVAETPDFLAFLDINPNSKGHTLCVPKREVDKIFDLDDATYVNLMSFSKRVAIAIAKVIPCKRVGLTVIGLEVPHAHVHLIPLHSMEDARFINKQTLKSEDFKEIAAAIKANF